MSTPAESSFLVDPKFWISVSSLLVAAWAGFNSWRSRRTATRALAISEQQEQRRQPKLGIYLADGYRRSLPNKRVFGFLVSVSNPSDINNSVALAELQLTYLMPGDIKAACRVPHNAQLAETINGPQTAKANIISLPLRIDAHQTVAGWLFFALDQSIVNGGTIDTHRIVLEDSHGLPAETEPIAVREWTNETPKTY